MFLTLLETLWVLVRDADLASIHNLYLRANIKNNVSLCISHRGDSNTHPRHMIYGDFMKIEIKKPLVFKENLMSSETFTTFKYYVCIVTFIFLKRFLVRYNISCEQCKPN